MSFKISLSVHELVDFVLRSGDIDTRIFNNATMLEGTRIHRYYQQKMDSNYKSEVFLSYDCIFDEFDVHVEGRADGIIEFDDYVIVDEIKSCVGDVEEFHKRHEKWHLGQAKVYAFIYCKKHNIADANIVLTYISQEDNDIVKKYFYNATIIELENYFLNLLFEYFEWHKLIARHKENVREKISTLSFPYQSFNLNQEKLMIAVNEIENSPKRRALIEAPTGIGKTISVLYPSLLNLRKYDRIFYLTAKNSGKEIVDSTLENIFKQDSGLKSIILTAKDKICPLKDSVCNPEACPFARGYFDKIHNALIDAFLSKEPVYNLDFFKKYEEKYQICPFEFQLDLSLFCDLIIGDYNYIFDPFVYLQRYVDKDLSQTLLLVDEGHNLLDRTRNMYSISFGINDIEKAKKSLKHLQNKTIKNNLNKIKKYFIEIGDYLDENGILEVEMFEEKFIKMLSKFHELYTSLSSKDSKLISKEYKNLFNQINKFLKLCEIISGEEFYSKYFKKIDENITINIFCASPTKYIDLTSKRFKNSIVFSATLTPFEYYNELFFNGDEDVEKYDFDSPFDSNRLNLNVTSNVSIKYKDRLSTISHVVSQIIAFISVKKGNYFVFVPSYEYLKLLKSHLNLDSVDFIYQEKEMKESERKEFINKFKNESAKTVVGVCVLGGSFSESINLVGESLIGVVVIGVGMPSISFENNVVKKYYDSIGLDGFYYSYVIPGMKNVIQSVGRLIRTSSDYGSVLLIDERYKYRNYHKLFRKERKNIKNIKNDYEIIENLNIFYKKILNQ